MSGEDQGLLTKSVKKVKKGYFSDTRFTEQQAIGILTSASEQKSRNKLVIGANDLSGVDPEILVKAITNLEKMDVGRAKLTKQQAVAMMTAISQGSKLASLEIGLNDLSGVDPGILAKVVTRLGSLDIDSTNLTQQQVVAVITAVCERNNMANLSMARNNLSGVDPEILAKAVTKLETLHISCTKQTQQHVLPYVTSYHAGFFKYKNIIFWPHLYYPTP